jgi:transposase
MQNEHRAYEKAFKIEAVHLVQTSGKSISQVARDLGISDSNLSRWCREAEGLGKQAFVGSGHQQPQEEELRRLKRENAILREERDILKKSVAIFSHP